MRKTLALLTLIGAAPVLLAACEDKKTNNATDAATTNASMDAGTMAAADAATSADPKMVARGDYLVNNVMGCPACHTPMGPQGPDMSKKFAGGLEVPEVFGTWRSLNITQDKKTGIGGWTDEQIATLIREGKRPNGDQVFPIMPYPFYNHLSDTDVKSIVAYLRTIKPIENAVEGNKDLKLPKVPVPKPEGKEPGKEPAAQGAYYATIMHCAQCHTPMDEKTGAPIEAKAFAGGQKFTLPFMGTGDLYSANITPDKKTGIGDWTDDQILTAIKEQKKKDGKPINGPMTILGMGWRGMHEDDLKNVVAFLHSLKPIENKVPKSSFKPRPPPGAAGSASGAPAASGKPPAGAGSAAPKK